MANFHSRVRDDQLLELSKPVVAGLIREVLDQVGEDLWILIDADAIKLMDKHKTDTYMLITHTDDCQKPNVYYITIVDMRINKTYLFSIEGMERFKEIYSLITGTLGF